MIHAPFTDGYNTAVSLPFQADLTTNMYVVNASAEDAATGKMLVAAPGTQEFATFTGGPIRGQLSLEGYDFIVAKTEVWVKDPNDAHTLLGVCLNDGLPVKMAANAEQIFFASAGIGYQIVGGAVVPIAAPPWTTLIDVAFLHSYFIGLDNSGGVTGGQFFISSPNDCATWDPLDFSTVPADSDKLRALAVSNDQLFVFGSVITQPFYDSGNADFPFLPNQSATVNTGTIARDSVISAVGGPQSNEEVLFFLTETMNGHAQFVKMAGYNPVRVSTDALDTIFQNYANIENAVCWSFQMNGHSFIQINFPDANASWRYDATVDRWAAATWLNPDTGLEEAHRGINHVFNVGRHLVGDRVSGILWEMSDEFFSDRDPDDTSAIAPMITTRRCLLPQVGTQTMFLARVELLAEVGIGDGTGAGAGDDPQVSMEMSFNGGRTFGNMRYATMGKQGNYNKRIVWTACGSGTRPCIEISSSAPVKRCWYGLDIQITKGVS